VANAMADLILMIQKEYWDMSHNELYEMLEDFGIASNIKEFFYRTINRCEE
jgi:hypothetical protein